MNLYHFSDEADIRRFVPRKLDYRMDEPAMVWAIDAFHAPHYLFPRDCPRVCLWPDADTTDSDKEKFFGHSRTSRIVAIESAWFERVRTGHIYRYVFDSSEFELYDANAGYYTTTSTVAPVSVEKIDDLPGSLVELGIELRITPSLMPLRDAILSSSVNFSMIRMKNARQD